MGKKNKELSHEEIWDDSALVRSWDDALEEYKRFHSIQARGENVDDLLQKLEAEEDGLADPASGQLRQELAQGEVVQEPEHDEVMEDDEVNENNDQRTKSEDVAKNEGTESLPETQQAANGDHSSNAVSMPPPIPSALVGAVQDDALKNLMMSWYYAGYYTGFYEGQQKARGQDEKKSST
ncbi:hypothetical protein L228DRAFT_266171 [Xylona heveae TC161]|uniref:Survival Motor Neuron Gemin2-binding domain-containing protein n=1 Tax=Xylona heveae (strain CBS 132557 / TC161) TaxID=1328760 RepID=A0A165J4E6_XYLHT|nr:hypothetical protein L228DRAFT_266171 [Xylona heveae TC161]KZF25715.1 hypothetical protein L228DRAFT_266171 [Xylona heveae TC161]